MSGPYGVLEQFPQFTPTIVIPDDKRPGKLKKVTVDRLGGWTSPLDSAHWMTRDAARALGVHHSFVLSRPPGATTCIFCVDVDGAIVDGKPTAIALSLIERLGPDVLWEISVSGTGIHGWGWGDVPLQHDNKYAALNLEFYTTSRHIVMGQYWFGSMDRVCANVGAFVAEYFSREPDTGNHVVPDEGPRDDWRGPLDDDELIRRMLNSALRERPAFGGTNHDDDVTTHDLWTANAEVLGKRWPDGEKSRPFDPSGADASLANRVLFWTGCDVARTDRIMRRSALVRDKWDDPNGKYATWLQRTICKEASRCANVYCDPRGVTSPEVADVPTGAPPAPSEPVAAVDVMDTLNLTYGDAKPTLHGVRRALREAGIWVGLDEFTGRKMIRCKADTSPRLLTPVDPVLIRQNFGERGFNPISADIMKDVIGVESWSNKFDWAIDWANTLVWDGVPRVDQFCARYWGAMPGEYSTAVGAYIWTALAGRALKPGVKADIAPILVGEQGILKSSAIKALVPNESQFGELDLTKDEVDLARQMRGKLVCELPELRGFHGKDSRATKSFITRAIDEWIKKYEEDSVTVPRRNILFGTTNEREFLIDPTGERRYAPLEVSWFDLPAMIAVREQLWAEGVMRYRTGGIAWQDVERLAKLIHSDFTVEDHRQDVIAAYLANHPEPVKLSDVYMQALKRPLDMAQKGEQREIGGIMRRLGRTKRTVRADGVLVKLWC